MDDILNLWSGSTTPSTSADRLASKAPSAEDLAAGELYQANPRPVPGPAPGELYGPSILAGAIDRRSPDLRAIGQSEAAQRTQRGDYLKLAKDVPEGLAVKIVNADIDAAIAASQPIADVDAAAHEEATRHAAWAAESLDALQATYGVAEAEALIERTRRYVQSRPALARLLERNGLGSRPAIVTELVHHVFSTGWTK